MPEKQEPESFEVETPGWRLAAAEADLTLWLPGDVPMFFRRVPPANWNGGDLFRIGERGSGWNSEEPVHTVRLAEPGHFFLGTFPVTQEQYRAVAEACPNLENADPSDFKGDMRPVDSVSWDDAAAWCEWARSNPNRVRLNDREGRERPLADLRLPREAEWEIACRAGTDTEYSSGNGEAALAEAGWYQENAGRGTHPVGELARNAWGLYDLHGNVWEWCRDVWHPAAYQTREDGVKDPEVTEDTPGSESAHRVLRGGSWIFTAADCRSAIRDRFRAGFRFGDIGFRVCLFPGPVADATSAGEAGGQEGSQARASDPDETEAGGTPQPESGR